MTYVTRFVVKDGEENGAGIVTWAPLDIKISKRGDTPGITENREYSVKRKQERMRQTDNRRVGNNKVFYETIIILNTTSYHYLEK